MVALSIFRTAPVSHVTAVVGLVAPEVVMTSSVVLEVSTAVVIVVIVTSSASIAASVSTVSISIATASTASVATSVSAISSSVAATASATSATSVTTASAVTSSASIATAAATASVASSASAVVPLFLESLHLMLGFSLGGSNLVHVLFLFVGLVNVLLDELLVVLAVGAFSSELVVGDLGSLGIRVRRCIGIQFHGFGV